MKKKPLSTASKPRITLPPFIRAAGKVLSKPAGLPVVGGVVTPNRPTYQAKTYKAPLKSSDYLRDVSKPIIPPSPVVQYSAIAWDSMRYLVAKEKGELGWVGAVEQVNPLYYIIHDIRVMEQMATGATFKYDDWNDAVTEMIMKGTLIPGRVDANLGHSHVNMGVGPSGTDEEQMMDLALLDDKDEHVLNADGTLKVKFSIQTIHNKRGDSHAAVYDWERKEYHPKCKVEVMSCLTQEQIDDLDMQLKRVKPMTYNTGGRGYNNQYNAYAGAYGQGAYGWDDDDESFIPNHLRPATPHQSQFGFYGQPRSKGKKMTTVIGPDPVDEYEVSQDDYVLDMENWSDRQWELWQAGYESEDVTSGLAHTTEIDLLTNKGIVK